MGSVALLPDNGWVGSPIQTFYLSRVCNTGSGSLAGLSHRTPFTSPGRILPGNLLGPFPGCSGRRYTGITASLRKASRKCRRVSTPITQNSGPGKKEMLWRSLFSDPSKWWDNRLEKPSRDFPDFKHKETGEGLWVIGKQNPEWVRSKISSIAPSLSIFSMAHMLSRYNKGRQYEKTMNLYKQMKQEGIGPIDSVFVHVLNACAGLQYLEEGRIIHRRIIESGCELNLFVSSSLVNMYAKCGSIDEAWRVFVEMPKRDLAAWTAMIIGYVKCGYITKGLELLQKMRLDGLEPSSVTFVGLLNACASTGALEDGRRVHEEIIRSAFESDVYVCSSLIEMFAKCGSMDDARRVFDEMPARNVVVWSAMILGCVKFGQGLEGLCLFKRMLEEGVKPNSATFVGVLNACASVGALQEGKLVHDQIRQSGCESEQRVANSLVDMYAKCGSMDDALKVFDVMPKRNVVGLNAMLIGYAMHGQGKNAVALFELMYREDSEIDELTFIGLLSACSHGGLIKKGLKYLDSMSSVYGVSPTLEHYICIVDMLGRAGRLEDAQEMLQTVPLLTCAPAWMSFLDACRIYGNVEMEQRAAKQVQELDPTCGGSYMLLSGIYPSVGNYDCKAVVQELRVRNALKKQLGCTWIEVNSEVHSFVVNDSQHPQIKNVHIELKRLSELMKEAGYVQETRFAFSDEEEERNVTTLSHHSEKLAIAFGLISTPAGADLCIVKNQDVCRDCHTAIKFIAKIAGRKINVRDANRFHFFEDGCCSCGDYW